MGIGFVVFCFIGIALMAAYAGYMILHIIFPDINFTAFFERIVSAGFSLVCTTCFLLVIIFVR